MNTAADTIGVQPRQTECQPWQDRYIHKTKCGSVCTGRVLYYLTLKDVICQFSRMQKKKKKHLSKVAHSTRILSNASQKVANKEYSCCERITYTGFRNAEYGFAYFICSVYACWPLEGTHNNKKKTLMTERALCKRFYAPPSAWLVGG